MPVKEQEQVETETEFGDVVPGMYLSLISGGIKPVV